MARAASQAEVKAAHRALVRRYHPDLVAPEERDAATRFIQQVNVAYGLLRDPQSRAAYDRAVGGSAAAMERLAGAAGVWAGRWWARNQARMNPNADLSRRAGRTFGRLTKRR